MNLRHGRTKYLVRLLCVIAGLWLAPSAVSAAIVDCATFDTGGNACEVCATDRYYLGEGFWMWDWFYNNFPWRPEIVFSNGASSANIDPMGHLSLNQDGESTNTRITSYYMPQGYVNAEGLNRLVIFNPRGLKFTNHPASRDQVAARVVYDLHYSVPSIDGSDSQTSFNWSYTEWVESTNNGRPFLTTNGHFDNVVSTKHFYSTTPPRRRHVECHNLYVDWCGDGVRNGAEACDLWSQNGVPGSGCSASCESVPVSPSCARGSITLPLTSYINQSTPGLCASGNVTGFVDSGQDSNGIIHYSWACDGSAMGGSCAADLDTSLVTNACIRGNITLPLSTPINQTTSGLCASGNVTGFVENYDASTRTVSYSWACDGSAMGGSCAANLTFTVGDSCIPGSTTGPQPLEINETTPWLCRFGSAEGFIRSWPDGSGTFSYAWGCAGSTIGGACIASYNSTIPPASCVRGSITLPLTGAITAWTSGLCASGNVTGFSESVDGSGNVNYTWACDGSAMGGSCAASYTPGGSSCQPGGVGASVGSPLSIASTGLCAAGPSAVHDFTQTAPDNSGNVYYSWACGSSMAGGLCVSHYVAISGGSSCNPGFTVGNVRGSITANTPWLCAAGPSAVHDFTATAPDSAGVIHYSWGCGSSMAGGLCSADYSGGGGGGGGWGGGGWGYCGDGYLGVGESCETHRWSVIGGVNTLVPNTTTPGCRSDCTYCGDGTLQIGHGEECDAAQPGCNVSCTLSTFTNPGQYPGDLNMTNPGGGVSKLADFRVIIGNNVSVFSDGTAITFDRSYPFYIDGSSGRQVCMRDTDPAIKRDNAAYCKTIAMSAPDTSLTLFSGTEPGVRNFVGNTDAIASGGYEDTTSSSFYVELGYLQEPIKTRIAKPAVAGTSWGGGYLARSAGYDVGYLNFDPAGASSQRFLANIESGNFTTVSLRTSDLGTEKNLSSLSYSAQADSTMQTRVDSWVAQGGDSINRSARTVTISTVPSGTTISSEYDFDTLLPAFRDQRDIRVQKYGDLVLNGLNLSEVRTIIVEDGDLRITGNITHAPSASYAFVVKNGDIIIDASVTSISGVFVVSNGSLIGTARTTDRLVIDGSVYGDIEPLLDTRTYIRGEASYEALSVGVIVNYSNRVLINPPPLVKDFVRRFSVDRVAK